MFLPGALGDVGERGDFGDGNFNLQRQVSDGALFARLIPRPCAIWVAFPSSSSRCAKVGLRLMELRCGGQVWHNRNGVDEVGDGNADDDRGRLRRDIGVVANAVVAFLVGPPFLLANLNLFSLRLDGRIERRGRVKRRPPWLRRKVTRIGA